MKNDNRRRLYLNRESIRQIAVTKTVAAVTPTTCPSVWMEQTCYPDPPIGN